jgi:hypothetical protein
MMCSKKFFSLFLPGKEDRIETRSLAYKTSPGGGLLAHVSIPQIQVCSISFFYKHGMFWTCIGLRHGHSSPP